MRVQLAGWWENSSLEWRENEIPPPGGLRRGFYFWEESTRFWLIFSAFEFSFHTFLSNQTDWRSIVDSVRCNMFSVSSSLISEVYHRLEFLELTFASWELTQGFCFLKGFLDSVALSSPKIQRNAPKISGSDQRLFKDGTQWWGHQAPAVMADSPLLCWFSFCSITLWWSHSVEHLLPPLLLHVIRD